MSDQVWNRHLLLYNGAWNHLERPSKAFPRPAKALQCWPVEKRLMHLCPPFWTICSQLMCNTIFSQPTGLLFFLLHSKSSFICLSPSAFPLYFTALLKGTLEGSWKGPHVDMHRASSSLTLCPYCRCNFNCVLWDWIDTVFGIRVRLLPSADKCGSNLGLNKRIGQSKSNLSVYIHSQLSTAFKDKD